MKKLANMKKPMIAIRSGEDLSSVTDLSFVMPVRETVIQFVFIATWLQITPSRRRPGPMSQPAGRFHQEPRCRKNVPSPALAERWVPAFPTDQVRGLKAHGKAREGHIGSPPYSDEVQLDYSLESGPRFRDCQEM